MQPERAPRCEIISAPVTLREGNGAAGQSSSSRFPLLSLQLLTLSNAFTSTVSLLFLMDGTGNVLHGARLIIAPLNEENWISWKPNVRAALMRKRQWRIVAGTRLLPTAESGDGSVEQWEEGNAEALGEVYLRVGNLRKHVLDGRTTAHNAWQALESHFGHAGATARLALKRALYTIEMRKEETFDAFVLQVTELVGRLRNQG